MTTDPTPGTAATSDATGLREAVEALAAEWATTVYKIPPGYPMDVNRFCGFWFKQPLLDILAAHPDPNHERACGLCRRYGHADADCPTNPANWPAITTPEAEKVEAWKAADEITRQLTKHADALRAAEAEKEALRAEHRDLVSRLGFGDNITEPMADNDTIVEWVEALGRDANEWGESQAWRIDCALAGHPDDEDCHEHDPSLAAVTAEAALTGLVAAVSELADEWDVRAKALGECTGPNCAGCQLGAAASRLRGRITADHAAALRAREAKAWDDAVTEGFDGGWLHDAARDDLLARNPYRADSIEQARP